MTRHTVYIDDENWLYSNGITREFGQNKVVILNDGESIFSAVMPLLVDPSQYNLIEYGYIECED